LNAGKVAAVGPLHVRGLNGAKGDYVQASEKAWGAAAQIVKAVAAKAGKELRSRGDL